MVVTLAWHQWYQQNACQRHPMSFQGSCCSSSLLWKPNLGKIKSVIMKSFERSKDNSSLLHIISPSLVYYASCCCCRRRMKAAKCAGGEWVIELLRLLQAITLEKGPNRLNKLHFITFGWLHHVLNTTVYGISLCLRCAITLDCGSLFSYQ